MTTESARQAVEVYTKGTRAWFPDDAEAWVSATCISNSITDDGKVRIVFEDDNNGKVSTRNRIQVSSHILSIWATLLLRNMSLKALWQKSKRTKDQRFHPWEILPRWSIPMIWQILAILTNLQVNEKEKILSTRLCTLIQTHDAHAR